MDSHTQFTIVYVFVGRDIPTNTYPWYSPTTPLCTFEPDLAQPDRFLATDEFGVIPNVELLFQRNVSSFFIKLEVKVLLNNKGIRYLLRTM